MPAAAAPSYTQAAATLGALIARAAPSSPWAGGAASLLMLAGLVGDVAVTRHTLRPHGPTEADWLRAEADLYRRRASSVSGPAGTADEAAPSRYLMEEGASADEDCFSCATAHLAGVEAGLEKAARLYERDGRCADDCMYWLQLAAEEPSALFARDWTPGKRFKGTPEQQAAQREVVERFAPQVRELQRAILDGPHVEQRAALTEAAVMLKEGVRFAEAGDQVTHPEVEWRRLTAESDLVGAERLTVGAFPADLSQELRRLRQDVGSRISAPKDLVDAGNRASALARQANREAFARMTPEDMRRLAARAREVREAFAAERRRLGMAPSRPVVAALGAIGRPPAQRTDVRPHPRVVDTFTMPSERVAEEVTRPEDVHRMYDDLEQAITARGTKIRYRNLPTTFDSTLFGLYDTDRDVMLLDDFAKTVRDPFAFQVLAHEATHALLDGPRCYASSYVPGTPYQDQPAEVRAQAASLAAMIELGLPVELADGTELAPGERQVDWGRLREAIGPEAERDVRWAAGWIVRGARGEDGTLAGERCPAKAGGAP